VDIKSDGPFFELRGFPGFNYPVKSIDIWLQLKWRSPAPNPVM